MKSDLSKLEEIHGSLLSLITPSGYEVVIRQQNGEDDDILSNAGNVADGTSSNKFVKEIVVSTNITENKKFNLDDARDLKLCDKYFIMVASRIFSIGQYIKFSYKWPDNLEVDYEEDLGLLIWEYGNPDKPFPEKGSPDYYEFRIKPHKFGKDKSKEIKLSSGKLIRYYFMNGHGERYLMNLPMDQQSINAELKARGIELNVNNNWVKIQNFKTFSSIDMMEIRKDVTENDRIINLITILEHPETKEKFEYPIIGTADFFYPRGI